MLYSNVPSSIFNSAIEAESLIPNGANNKPDSFSKGIKPPTAHRSRQGVSTEKINSCSEVFFEKYQADYTNACQRKQKLLVLV